MIPNKKQLSLKEIKSKAISIANDMDNFPKKFAKLYQEHQISKRKFLIQNLIKNSQEREINNE